MSDKVTSAIKALAEACAEEHAKSDKAFKSCQHDFRIFFNAAKAVPAPVPEPIQEESGEPE